MQKINIAYLGIERIDMHDIKMVHIGQIREVDYKVREVDYKVDDYKFQYLSLTITNKSGENTAFRFYNSDCDLKVINERYDTQKG